MNVITGKWLFNTKRLADGTVSRYKARYVCRGYTQQQGIDYNDVFAPVGKHTSFRVLIATAARNNYLIRHMDVKTAFLQSTVHETIYVNQPQGFEKFGGNGATLVMKLKRSLYGLKQSPRNWHSTVHQFLLSIGFTSSDADPCVYVRADQTIILLYVDDLLIMAVTDEVIDVVVSHLITGFL
jgi:Reverse transcriptase (RNA-dependent DNA polymerase)